VLPSLVTRSVPPEIGGGGTLAVIVGGKLGLGPVGGPALPTDDPAAGGAQLGSRGVGELDAVAPHSPPEEGASRTIWSAQPPASAEATQTTATESPSLELLM
jgi:hypothetical protein